MTESDIIKLVKNVVRQEMAPILMGLIQSNESQTRSTFQRFPSESPIPHARSIMPFGVSSRAPAQTAALIVPVDGNPTHLNVVGHFDESRPTTADGETALYNAYGQLVYLSNGKIQIGTKASSEPLVLGNVFKTMMDTLLDAIINHTHIGNLGYSTSPPENDSDFQDIKASPIDDKAILSDIAFTEKGS